MNILFVYDRQIIPSFGGLERVTHLLALELTKRGYAVTFLNIGNDDNIPEEIGDINQLYLPVNGFPDKVFQKKFQELLNSLYIDVIIYQGNSNEILKCIGFPVEKARKISVVHFQPYPLLDKERIIKRKTPFSDLRLKGKLLKILALILPSVFRIFYLRKTSALYASLIGNSNKLVLLSPRFQNRLQLHCKAASENNITAINNPLTFTPTIHEQRAKENCIVFVSRMYDPQKNISDFIDVWKKFHKDFPDWNAYIIGSGDHLDRMKKYARKRKVKNLTFTGNVTNVQDYYDRAKIFCMTSTFEGWGMVLTEAMAFGAVPVAFDSFESIHDIIDHEKNGLLVPPFKVDGMVEALSRLASDEGYRASLASDGKEKVKNFEVSKIVEHWERLFLSLM